MVNITITDKTAAALDNLCKMLDIQGDWDVKVFELSRRAFMAKAQVDKMHKELMVNPSKRRIPLMVKRDTEAALLTLYENLYPFQDFIGWNKYLAQLVELVHDNIGSLVMRDEENPKDNPTG